MKLAAIAVAATIAAARPAAADTSDRTEVIAADLFGDTLMATIFSERIDRGTNAAPFWTGLVVFAVGGPAIHAARGDWGRAGLSLGDRVVGPLLGMTVGDKLCMWHHDPNDTFLPCLDGLILGGAIGLVGAEVVDWTAISRGPAPSMPIAHVVSFGGSF